MKKILNRLASYMVSQNANEDYSKKPLTMELLENGTTITLTLPPQINSNYVTSVSYRINYGQWIITNNSSDTVTISVSGDAGDIIEWRGSAKRYRAGSYYSYFSDNGMTWNLYGNIVSLVREQDFSIVTSWDYTEVFSYLFMGTSVEDATNLVLPFQLIVNGNNGTHYAFLFKDCTSLIYPPKELPSTSIGGYSYYQMFMGCTSLLSMPTLPVHLNDVGCFALSGMFKNCSSLCQNVNQIIFIDKIYGHSTTGQGSNFSEFMSGCSLIETVPSFIIDECSGTQIFNQAFLNCTGLTDVSDVVISIEASTGTFEFVKIFSRCTHLERGALLRMPQTNQNSFTRTYEACNMINYVYFDIDSIYTDGTAANDAFHYMFINSFKYLWSASGHLFLYGLINSKSAFDGMYIFTDNANYTGWSPNWTIDTSSPITKIITDEFPDDFISSKTQNDQGYNDYSDWQSLSDFIDATIDDPQTYECNYWNYYGNIILLNDKAYYIWESSDFTIIPDSYAPALLLTTTANYEELHNTSLAYYYDWHSFMSDNPDARNISNYRFKQAYVIANTDNEIVYTQNDPNSSKMQTMFLIETIH